MLIGAKHRQQQRLLCIYLLGQNIVVEQGKLPQLDDLCIYVLAFCHRAVHPGRGVQQVLQQYIKQPDDGERHR